MFNKTNLYCPINPSNKCDSDCAWYIGGKCAMKCIADRIVHIAIDSNDSCQFLEDIAVATAIANAEVEEE